MPLNTFNLDRCELLNTTLQLRKDFEVERHRNFLALFISDTTLTFK